MRMVGYYAWHTFINSIKKMFRSTFVIVLALIVGVGLVFGVTAGVITSFVSNDTKIVEEDTRNMEAEENLEEEEATLPPEISEVIMGYVEAGIELLLIAFLLWGIYTGSKKGSDIFLMADVNFLFTAPLHPQSVLMFRLSFQMVATLLGSIYLLFQIPNLVTNLGLSMFAVMMLFAAWIVLLIFQKLVSVLAYTLAATNEKWKGYILPFIIGLSAVILGGTGAVYLWMGRDLTKMLSILYTSRWSRMVPMIGWFKGMIMTAVEGNKVASLLYFLALLAGMVLLIFLIWHVKADFYEDAMTGAVTRDEIMNAAKEGRKTSGKERSDKVKRNAELGGFGASVFLKKELYNRKRFAKLGFITNTMLTYVMLSVGLSWLSIKVFEVSGFVVVGVVIAGFAFFRNYGNPIATETSMNWLYMVPDSPYKKVFYAMMAGTYGCVLDLLPALIIGMVLTGEQPYVMMLWLVMLVTMDFMLSTVGMLLEVLLPATALDTVKAMVQMVLKMFMIIVIIVLFAIGGVLVDIWLGLVLNIVVNCIIGGILFWIYPAMLHEGIKES